MPIAVLIAASAIATAQTETGRVIGKLGQTIDDAPIRAAANGRSRVYYTTKKYQYLVVNSSKYDGWLSVVLQNGRSGYISADKVARLPYDVRVKSQPDSSQPTVPSSRSGGVASRTNGIKGQMLQYSYQFIGTPYKWGGNDLNSGIDCSGFVKQLFGTIGVDLPRTARQQALVGRPIEQLEDLQPGDRLYFWDSKRGYIGHTGIFIGFREGHGFFIHSSSGRKGVQTDDLANPKWRKILVAARRDN